MKRIKKFTAISVAACMAIGLKKGYISAEASTAITQTDASKNTYIVQMEDSNTLEEISEKYGEYVSDDSKSYENLENENCIVLDLTENQAASLSDADGIDFLESDLEMQGAVDNMTPVSECDTEWNINMVNADIEENTADINNKDNPVKIAVIDSGIDYTNGINVVKRKNFIPDADNVNILYKDASGHGTSVAGVIAASCEENKDIAGIARNVEIYSAKVLNSNNTAPISRVVEGIYWAIEQGVDIINLSLGTSKPSELLEKAVKDAYGKGILIIASAGNNEKAGVEYPAAYDKVMAVASVDSKGEHSSMSAVGDKVEISAPGEKVKTASCFDGEIVVSGTSIATPHITAIAARLWEKNRTKSAKFIRGLIDASANAVGEKSEYGYGIVDLSYAMEIYDEYAKNYIEDGEESIEETLENIEDAAEMTENDASIEVYENDYVTGRWSVDDHGKLAGLSTFTGDDFIILKWGAVISDKFAGFSKMQYHPYFHGRGYGVNSFSSSKKKVKTNYIASYILLTKMAEAFNNKNKNYSDPATVPGLSESEYKRMCTHINGDHFEGNSKNKKTGKIENNTMTWRKILTVKEDGKETAYDVTKKNKALILYGMALHTAADTFAHSAYVNGKRLHHPVDDEDDEENKENKENKENCDDTEYYPNRYNCAKVVAINLLAHAEAGKRGSVTDWIIPSTDYKGKFKLVSFSEFAKAVNSTSYNYNKLCFDAMNINTGSIIEN